MLNPIDQNSQQSDQDEQDYERQFNKIGRDFVYIGDLNKWIADLQARLAPLGVILPVLTNSQAKSMAKEYQDNANNGSVSPDKYDDLIETEE